MRFHLERTSSLNVWFRKQLNYIYLFNNKIFTSVLSFLSLDQPNITYSRCILQFNHFLYISNFRPQTYSSSCIQSFSILFGISNFRPQTYSSSFHFTVSELLTLRRGKVFHYTKIFMF